MSMKLPRSVERWKFSEILSYWEIKGTYYSDVRVYSIVEKCTKYVAEKIGQFRANNAKNRTLKWIKIASFSADNYHRPARRYHGPQLLDPLAVVFAFQVELAAPTVSEPTGWVMRQKSTLFGPKFCLKQKCAQFYELDLYDYTKSQSRSSSSIISCQFWFEEAEGTGTLGAEVVVVEVDTDCVPGWGRSGVRQIGHESCISSHRITHGWWNMCLQFGSWITSSFSSKSHRHTEHYNSEKAFSLQTNLWIDFGHFGLERFWLQSL